jgi:AraC-like DNA-binding protein
MALPAPALNVVRHRSPLGSWEMASREPGPRLVPFIRGYTGYRERTPGPLRRREVAWPFVVLIIELGPSLRILGPRPQACTSGHRGGFVAGIDDSFTTTEMPGESLGIQVNFTPIGAYRFFALPMDSLARRVVGLEDLLGAAARRLVARLTDLPGWESRFALLDQELAARIERGPATSPWVACAWSQIQESGGLVPIRALAREAGFSRKHLVARFHQEIGLSPKSMAQLVRFDRVMQGLRSGRYQDWAQVAVDCGYYDQAHFIREFRRFSGSTPGEFLRRRLPDGGGFAG